MKLHTAGLDLLAALAAAKAVVAATLGKDSVAMVLGLPGGGSPEILDPDDLPDAVSTALRGPAGRFVYEAVQRSAQPVRFATESLPDEAGELRVALHQHRMAALAVFPLLGEAGVIGFMAAPYSKGEELPSGEGEAWRLACRAVQGTQLIAASAALRSALAHDRRRPAQLFEGLLVLDRGERVMLANGVFEGLPGWSDVGPVARLLASIPGGEGFASLEASGAEGLAWTERVVSFPDGAKVPMALASVDLADADVDLDGGRVVFARDLRVDVKRKLDGTGRMLALAMRVSHIADHMSHAIRLAGAGEAGRSAWTIEGWSREIAEAGRLVSEALDRCLPGEDQESLDFNRLLEDVLTRYGPEFGPEGVKLFTSLRPDLPVVPADRLALLRAVRILVQEARESLRPTGGTLTVRTWADDTWVYGAISDDGAGGDQETAPVAVPLFDRKDESSQAGLKAVREIVERFDGRLLEERRPKVWNRITIMLRTERRSTRRERPAAAVVDADLPIGQRSGLCVLVVDDNAALRSVLRRYLERRGHDITEATDGVEGLRLVQSNAFDRLIVDIQMPNKDGPEFYEDLHAVDPAMQSRTIFVTGGFLSDSVERFIRESGRPSVKKPFDLAEMARTVEG